MQGAGFYNSNSALQAAAMERVLPLLDGAITNKTAEGPAGTFTVVEYGSAQGKNSYASLFSFDIVLNQLSY